MKHRRISNVGWIVLATGLCGCGQDGLGTRKRGDQDRTLTAVCRRGPLRVTVIASGRIQAEKAERIFHKVDGGSLTVTQVVEEGDHVRAGDVLVTFDSAKLEEQLVTLKTKRQQTETAREIAEKEKLIAEHEGAENRRQARFKLDAARLARKKYEHGELPQTLKRLAFEIERGEAELKRAVDSFNSISGFRFSEDASFFASDLAAGVLSDRLRRAFQQHQFTLEPDAALTLKIPGHTWQVADAKHTYRIEKVNGKIHVYDQELLKHGFVTATQIEEEALRKRSAEIKLELAKADLEVYKKYDREVTLATKQANVIAAEANLKKADGVSENRLKQKVAGLEEKKENLRQVIKRIKEVEEKIAGTTLRAPTAGIVIFGDQDRRSRYREPDVRVGASWHKNQVILTIPDMRQLVVKLQVPEADITKIEIGQSATITSDAYPNFKAAGTVRKIGSVPKRAHWWQTAKTFDVFIKLPPGDLGLKPGVTAKAEVLIEELQDVLSIPVNAVFVHEGRTFVYVRHSGGRVDPREVELGESNDTQVEILDGLEEGEQALLYEPEGVALPPAPPATGEEKGTGKGKPKPPKVSAKGPHL